MISKTNTEELREWHGPCEACEQTVADAYSAGYRDGMEREVYDEDEFWIVANGLAYVRRTAVGGPGEQRPSRP